MAATKSKKGGRSGAPNKNKAFLMNRLQDLYGDDFHPILKIAGNCVKLQKYADDRKKLPERNAALQVANAEWSRIAEYTEPKLKAVQVDLNGDMEGLVLEMHYGGKTVSSTKVKPAKKKAKAKTKKTPK